MSNETNEETLTFKQGWDALIAEVKPVVLEYIECAKLTPHLDPWEEWLPHYLYELSEDEDETPFDEGWDAAIMEIGCEINLYRFDQDNGTKVDPWEEWVPRLLDKMAEQDQPQAL
jgi:hypothetical protein